jgi:hypothetical protein
VVMLAVLVWMFWLFFGAKNQAGRAE